MQAAAISLHPRLRAALSAVASRGSVRAMAGHFATVTTGLTPERMALLIAVGFVLGTFPVLGLAGVLCAIAAVMLRLNIVALQIVGQIVTPAQYALLLPLARVGRRLIGSQPGIGGAVLHAVAGWCCVCVPLGIVLFITLAVMIRLSPGNWERAPV